MNRNQRGLRAFTVVDLLISLAVILLIVWLLITPTYNHASKSQRIRCVNNLKNLGLATRIFPANNSDRSLTAAFAHVTTPSAIDYFRALSNELASPKILICPADRRAEEASSFSTISNLNVSYFVNRVLPIDTPNAFLFGDRNLRTNGVAVPSGATVRPRRNDDLGWTREIHADTGNIAMGDGSVRQFSSAKLREFLTSPGFSSNILLVP